MSVEGKLEAALAPLADCKSSAEPVWKEALEALRLIAVELHQKGHSRQAIYDHFLEFDGKLIEEGREMQQTALEDGMDILTGTFHGRDWGIPK